MLGAFSSRKKITLEETKETNSNLEFKKPFSDHAEAKSIAKEATVSSPKQSPQRNVAAGRVATSPNAAETASIDLSDDSKNLLDNLDQLLTNAGFSDSREKWIRSLFDPNFDYKDNPSFIIERKKWELNLKLYQMMQSQEFKAMNTEARNNKVWKLWDEMQVLKEKRQDHDRKLKGGNIEMEDGTYSCHKQLKM